MEDKDLLTLEDARAYLGVSRATFFKLVRQYGIQRYRIPAYAKRVYFRRGDMDRLREPVRDEREAS